MIRMRSRVWIVALLVLFVAVPDVYAHRPEPGNQEGVTRIPDPVTSYAYYREIVSPDQVHVYEFQARAGQFFHAGINIPQLEGLQDFGVTFALLGPGLPPIEEQALHSHNSDEDLGPDDVKEDGANSLTAVLVSTGLSDELKSGATGVVVVESVTGADFFEPFTQTRYWGRQELDLNLPEGGTYRLLIWNPHGKTGKYVLDTGTEEVFGVEDLLRFPLWWLNARVYFEQTPQLIGASAVLFAAALGLVVYRLRQ